GDRARHHRRAEPRAALRGDLRGRQRAGGSQLRVARSAHPVQLMAVRAAEPPVTVVPDAAPRSSLLAELVRFSRRNTLSAIGGLVGVLTIVVALAAPLLAPYDPLKADFRHINKPPTREPGPGTD